MIRLLAPLALIAVLAACSSETECGAGELTDRTTYPAGPYGTTEGSILAPLTFQNPDGTPFSLDTDVFKNPDNRVLMITTTAGWCSACIEEQPKLRALYNDLHGQGLAAMAGLFEDSEYGPPTGEQAAQWKERYDLPFPVVTDAPFVLSAYYNREFTPMMMVVDVDTMEILLVSVGFDEQLIRSTIEANASCKG